MGLTFTIGGLAYGVLSSASGNYALAMIVKPADYAIIPYHIIGSYGSYTVNGNLKQVEILARISYVDSLANVYAHYEGNKSLWQGNPIDIQEPGGVTYTRCFLQPAGGIIKEPHAIGRRTNDVRMDVEFTFISFGGVSS